MTIFILIVGLTDIVLGFALASLLESSHLPAVLSRKKSDTVGKAALTPSSLDVPDSVATAGFA